MSTGDLPFPCRQCLRRAGCQESRLSEPWSCCWHTRCCRQFSAERPGYRRVSYCSFSCPLTQTPSCSTTSKKLFRHTSVFATTHSQSQDTVRNCRYWGTSPLRSQSNSTREKQALGRRRTRRALLLKSHSGSGADRNSYHISVVVTRNSWFFLILKSNQ